MEKGEEMSSTKPTVRTPEEYARDLADATCALSALKRLLTNEDIVRSIHQGQDILLDGPQLVAIALSNMEDMEAAHRIEPAFMNLLVGGFSADGFTERCKQLAEKFTQIKREAQ